MKLPLLHRWKKNQQISIMCIIAVLCTGTIIFIFAGYWLRWTWTGFLNKTFWDWMQLLIIPVVLAIAAFLFNLATSRNEQKIAQQRDQTAQEIALDSQREALLQTYLDRMSELLLDKHLRESPREAGVRSIARARTLTVLRQLDARRKGSLLQFLYESNLTKVAPGGNFISLKDADLTNADLIGLNLHDISLRGANLNEAHLHNMNLHNADLSWANLANATLEDTNLGKANLSRSTLNGVVLSGNLLSKANLSDTDLRKTTLCGTTLNEARRRKIYAHRTDLPEQAKEHLIYTNLRQADLSKAILSGMDLRYIDLTQANLSEANLNRADMSYIDLDQANLSKADLRGAILRGTSLRQADLSEADLSEADLSEADLTGANLTKTKLDKARLDGTKPDKAIPEEIKQAEPT